MGVKVYALLDEVRACRLCAPHLPDAPRPILQIDPRARILIAGQAPGLRAHVSGIPFEDASGQRLREWMGVSREAFYDAARISILPMAFCYPGRGRSGDLPPRAECAATWRTRLLAAMPRLQLTLVIGQYAQEYHLRGSRAATLTETVRAWRRHGPALLPLPHPSPRNTPWLRANPWFERELLPDLRARVSSLL